MQCWDRLMKDIYYIVNTTLVQNQVSSSSRPIQSLTHFRKLSFLAIALSTDDTIAIVTYILIQAYHSGAFFMCREHSILLPSHLRIIDYFCPFDLSTTYQGYVYGVIDTAVMWIYDYGSRRLLR